MAKKRKGMIIKNTNSRAVEIEMTSRTIRLRPGEEQSITAEEVRDPVMREKLQIRAVSIVRPTTDGEEDDLRRKLEEEEEREH